jgi:hypothetical protein
MVYKRDLIKNRSLENIITAYHGLAKELENFPKVDARNSIPMSFPTVSVPVPPGKEFSNPLTYTDIKSFKNYNENSICHAGNSSTRSS